jgi:hypothetical protein
MDLTEFFNPTITIITSQWYKCVRGEVKTSDASEKKVAISDAI